MKILFIYPFPPARTVVAARAYHYGIGYLSSMLVRDGHQTALLNLNSYQPGVIKRALKLFRPNLVAISATSDQFPLAARVVQRINRLPEPRPLVVLGGLHATMAPEEAVALPGLLGICRGEGDLALPALANSLEGGEEPWDILNFWFRRDGEVVENELGPLVEDLDWLGFPDRELFDYRQIVSRTGKASFSTGRGCPFLCPYCANHALRKIYQGCGRYLRQRSPGHVVDEVVEVLERYKGVRQVVFEDETFTHNRKWVRSFCEEYARRVDRPFACSTRVDQLDENLIRWMKEANCFQFRLGIESGDEELRSKVVGKKISNDGIRQVCGLVHEADISLWTFNMVGLPGETEDNIRQTIALNREVQPETPFVSVFRPYQGTALYRECKEKGWISDRQVHSFFQNVSMLDQPSITARKVAYYHNVFPWEVSFPRWAFVVRFLSRVPIPGTLTKSLYDMVFPLVLYTYKLKRFLTGK